MLNERGYRSSTGRLFTKDTIREILKNRIYIGEVCYQEMVYLPNGGRDVSVPVEWRKGQHEGIISEALFYNASPQRAKRTYRDGKKLKGRSRPKHPYLLKGLIYCQHCLDNPIRDLAFPYWGKMQCRMKSATQKSYYQCAARENGYECSQKGIQTAEIDTQVTRFVLNFEPPSEWKETAIDLIAADLEQEATQRRLEEFKSTVDNRDMAIEQFLLKKAELIRNQEQTKKSLDRLTPVKADYAAEAAHLIDYFGMYWERCAGDIDHQRSLLLRMIDRIFIQDDRVIAVQMRGGYQVSL
jgi:hypothetical protein